MQKLKQTLERNLHNIAFYSIVGGVIYCLIAAIKLAS